MRSGRRSTRSARRSSRSVADLQAMEGESWSSGSRASSWQIGIVNARSSGGAAMGSGGRPTWACRWPNDSWWDRAEKRAFDPNSPDGSWCGAQRQCVYTAPLPIYKKSLRFSSIGATVASQVKYKQLGKTFCKACWNSPQPRHVKCPLLKT